MAVVEVIAVEAAELAAVGLAQAAEAVVAVQTPLPSNYLEYPTHTKKSYILTHSHKMHTA